MLQMVLTPQSLQNFPDNFIFLRLDLHIAGIDAATNFFIAFRTFIYSFFLLLNQTEKTVLHGILIPTGETFRDIGPFFTNFQNPL